MQNPSYVLFRKSFTLCSAPASFSYVAPSKCNKTNAMLNNTSSFDIVLMFNIEWKKFHKSHYRSNLKFDWIKLSLNFRKSPSNYLILISTIILYLLNSLYIIQHRFNRLFLSTLNVNYYAILSESSWHKFTCLTTQLMRNVS